MATRNEKIPEYRRVVFEESSGDLIAQYHWSRYRFMFTDGRTFDVVAIRDDSDLRGAVLDHFKAEGIAGVATLPVEAAPPAKPAPKKRSVRRVDTPPNG